MPKIMHVVLQKLASGTRDSPATAESFLSSWTAQAKALEGKIPGLLEMNAGRCIEGSSHKAKGFDMVLVCTLKDEHALAVYGTHPLHEDLKAAGKGKFNDDEKIIYDFEI